MENTHEKGGEKKDCFDLRKKYFSDSTILGLGKGEWGILEDGSEAFLRVGVRLTRWRDIKCWFRVKEWMKQRYKLKGRLSWCKRAAWKGWAGMEKGCEGAASIVSVTQCCEAQMVEQWRSDVRVLSGWERHGCSRGGRVWVEWMQQGWEGLGCIIIAGWKGVACR